MGNVDRSMDIWDDVALPWRRCMELAWESFLEGSMPVGSVVTDGEGSIVAEGRNRSFGRDGVGVGIEGTFIAHAEINALAKLPPGDYDHHTIWSTLEPCFMCSAAIIHSHVGTVRFAAVDPLMAGVDRIPELNAWMSNRWPDRQGPLESAVARFCGVLPAMWTVRRRPDGVVSSTYEAADPNLMALARTLLSDGTIARLSGAPASTAFEGMGRRSWPGELSGS